MHWTDLPCSVNCHYTVMKQTTCSDYKMKHIFLFVMVSVEELLHHCLESVQCVNHRKTFSRDKKAHVCWHMKSLLVRNLGLSLPQGCHRGRSSRLDLYCQTYPVIKSRFTPCPDRGKLLLTYLTSVYFSHLITVTHPQQAHFQIHRGATLMNVFIAP